jgi:hypothetical protein
MVRMTSAPLILLLIVLFGEGLAIEVVFLYQPGCLLDVPDRLIRRFVEVRRVDTT